MKKTSLVLFCVIYCATAFGALMASEPYRYKTEIQQFIDYSSRYAWVDWYKFKIIKAASIKYSVPEKYIFATIETESGGRNIPGPENPDGSRDFGLMQLNSKHGFKIDDMMRIEFNIDRGTWYLSECRKRAVCWYEATSRYNTGHGADWIQPQPGRGDMP